MVDFVKDNANSARGCILMGTHKALLEIPFWANQGAWECIMDETPAVEGEVQINIATKESKAFIDIFEAVECNQPKWLRLHCKRGRTAELARWVKNSWQDSTGEVIGGDTGLAGFRSLFQTYSAPFTEVYVSRRAWTRLQLKGVAQLDFHWFKSSDVLKGWKSVTVMGANFENSLISKLWTDIDFRPSTTIMPNRQHYDERTGRRLTIHYFTDAWSKTQFKKIVGCDRLSTEAAHLLHPLVREVFGEAPFGWVGNLCMGDDAFTPISKTAIRIPNSPYGLNQFGHLQNIVFFSALHNTPSHFAFLADLFGLHPLEITTARSYEIAHQAIMRSDLRNPDSDLPINVIVPNRDLADWLGRMFPGSRVVAHDLPGTSHLGSDSKRKRGRPSKTVKVDAAERQRRYRAKKEEIMSLKNTLSTGIFARQIHTTQEANVHSTEVYEAAHNSWSDVIADLEDIHGQLCTKKENATLINGGRCDLKTADGKVKGRDNFSAINGMWLDIDDGEMSPHEFATEIFPTYKLLVFNSFNNGKPFDDNEPPKHCAPRSKYRALILTSQGSTPAAYEAIWDSLKNQIEGFGYFVGSRDSYLKRKRFNPNLKWSGVDVTKRAANSFFYVPCQSPWGKEHSFFDKYLADDRSLLNPSERLEYLLPERNEATDAEPEAATPSSSQTPMQKLQAALKDELAHASSDPNVQASRVKRADAYWDETKHIDGARHPGFFAYAVRLKHAGLTLNEIKTKLKDAAALSPHSEKRKKQIPDIMNSLKG